MKFHINSFLNNLNPLNLLLPLCCLWKDLTVDLSPALYVFYFLQHRRRFSHFFFPFPLKTDARLPDMTSRKTRQLIGDGWLIDHNRRLCSIKAVRSLYKLTGRHRASAAAAVGPFFPSTTQSVPVPLTYDHTRWLRLLHNAWDPPYMHSYMWHASMWLHSNWDGKAWRLWF